MVPALGGAGTDLMAIEMLGDGVEGLALGLKINDLLDDSLFLSVLEELSVVAVIAVRRDPDVAYGCPVENPHAVTVGRAEIHAMFDECAADNGIADVKLTSNFSQGESITV